MNSKQGVFAKQKAECLSGVDMSRKGSIDAPIVELVALINAQHNYFTTSSCSGRVAVVEYAAGGRVQKEGCRWLLMSHDECTAQQVAEAVEHACADASFKWEALVLHVQCASLQHARALLAEAVASGHRNSGISVSRKGKIVVAVRSTHSLEVPLTHDGVCLVSQQYLEHITELGNAKMKENLVRIDRFTEGFKKLLIQDDKDSDSVPCERSRITRQKGSKLSDNSAAPRACAYCLQCPLCSARRTAVNKPDNATVTKDTVRDHCDVTVQKKTNDCDAMDVSDMTDLFNNT